MTVRVRYRVEVSISSSTAEEKDLANIKSEVLVDSQGEGGSWKTFLPASSTDVQLQLPNIGSAKFLFIRATTRDPLDTLGTISIKKDSTGGEAIAISPLATAKESHFLLTTSGISALYATNALAVNVDVTVSAAGD